MHFAFCTKLIYTGQNHWASYNKTWHKASVCKNEPFFSSEGPCSLNHTKNILSKFKIPEPLGKFQHYGIVMALRKYFYLFKLFSGEQVAHGPFLHV